MIVKCAPIVKCEAFYVDVLWLVTSRRRSAWRWIYACVTRDSRAHSAVRTIQNEACKLGFLWMEVGSLRRQDSLVYILSLVTNKQCASARHATTSWQKRMAWQGKEWQRKYSEQSLNALQILQPSQRKLWKTNWILFTVALLRVELIIKSN